MFKTIAQSKEKRREKRLLVNEKDDHWFVMLKNSEENEKRIDIDRTTIRSGFDGTANDLREINKAADETSEENWPNLVR